MSKFEQLLDLIVNEEMDKANELFHEIVVEKSREIYENLIAEEEQDDVDEAADEEMDESEEEMDESADEEMDESEEEMDESADEEMDESADEEADESMDLEDSYMMDGDDEMDDMGEPGGLEKTDDLEGDVGADEEDVEFNVRDAIEKLEAALAAMGGEPADDMAKMGDEVPDAEMPEDMMGFMEGRRLTREYVEKVGNDWDKNSMKTQGQYVGAGSGDKEGSPVEGRSPIASGKNKPGPAGVNARNLVQNSSEGQSNTGTSPGKVNHGVTPTSGDKLDKGQGNVPGGKMGVKNLSKVAGGHGAEKKGGGPGPVGSGTGDKAGQTSVKPVQQMLKPYTK